MPVSNPRHVILVPGADAITFEEDRAEAGLRGIGVTELTLSAFVGHPIDDREAHFDYVAKLIIEAASEIRQTMPIGRIAAIGRNNGGGQLAWALAKKLQIEAVVLVGAIPEISFYRKESQNPSAVKFRNSLTGDDEFNRIDVMKPLDIVSSSKNWLETACLIQFGRKDPYIDDTSTEAAQNLSQRYHVEWLYDDHAMVSAQSLQQRWDFIEDKLSD